MSTIRSAIASQTPGIEISVSDMLSDMPGITDTSAPNQGVAGGPTGVLDDKGRIPERQPGNAS